MLQFLYIYIFLMYLSYQFQTISIFYSFSHIIKSHKIFIAHRGDSCYICTNIYFLTIGYSAVKCNSISPNHVKNHAFVHIFSSRISHKKCTKKNCFAQITVNQEKYVKILQSRITNDAPQIGAVQLGRQYKVHTSYTHTSTNAQKIIYFFTWKSLRLHWIHGKLCIGSYLAMISMSQSRQNSNVVNLKTFLCIMNKRYISIDL